MNLDYFHTYIKFAILVIVFCTISSFSSSSLIFLNMLIQILHDFRYYSVSLSLNQTISFIVFIRFLLSFNVGILFLIICWVFSIKLTSFLIMCWFSLGGGGSPIDYIVLTIVITVTNSFLAIDAIVIMLMVLCILVHAKKWKYYFY